MDDIPLLVMGLSWLAILGMLGWGAFMTLLIVLPQWRRLTPGARSAHGAASRSTAART